MLDLNFPFPSFNSVGDALKPTFNIYKDNFALIFKVVLAFYLPLLVAQAFLPALNGELVVSAGFLIAIGFGIIGFLASMLLQGALIYGAVVYLRTGANPPLSECFKWGVKKSWVIFAASLESSLIAGAGFILLIIPGIILFVMYSLVVPVAAVEDVGVGKALQRSMELTKGYKWRIFGTQFIFWLITTAASWLVTGSLTASETNPFWIAPIATFTNALLQAVGTVLSLVIYLGILADRRNASDFIPNTTSLHNAER